MVEKKAIKTKIKKKGWVKIIAPKLFHEKLIGESFVALPSNLIGRSVSINLFALTGDIKKQNYTGFFKVTELSGGVAKTLLNSLEMNSVAVKRLVRKGRNKIDDSFIVETSLKGKVRIKPVIVTLAKTSKGIQSILRMKVREKLKELASKYTFEDFINEIFNTNIQRVVKGEIKKIFPLKSIDIRAIKLISSETEKKLPLKEEKIESEEAKNL